MIIDELNTNAPWESMLMATAEPMTSWISLPMIAISTITQRIIRGVFGYSLLQTSARFIPIICSPLEYSF